VSEPTDTKPDFPGEKAYDRFAKVRSLIERHFRVKPWIYWLDFGVTMMVAWGALIWAAPLAWGFLKGFSLLLSALAFFRGVIFVHEIVHIRRTDLPGFAPVWNAACGFLFFLPDYTYIVHSAHHRPATFSTADDPEYIPLAYQRPVQILMPFLVFPLLPGVMAFRFLILGPLSLVTGGPLRAFLLRHASSLKMNPAFQWKNISEEDRRRAAVQDMACVLWWAAALALVLRLGMIHVIAAWWVVSYLMLTLNHFRSLVSHRYVNRTGGKVSYEEQLLDSVTITGFSPLADVLAPVGLRYHSLHHLFPTLPYHALREAHDVLDRHLPADHLYRQTLSPGLWAAFQRLFRAVQAAQTQARAA
jgi:fatty acid desaturase